MTKPTFIQGVLAAAGLAFVASAVLAVLTPIFGLGSIVRLVIPAVSLAYLLFLLRYCTVKTGRVTALAAWAVLSAAAWWVSPPFLHYLLLHVAAIWLLRSLYFYTGVIPALVDLGLSAFSVIAFAWSLSRTGSVFLATWSLFLVQALFVGIPSSLQSRRAGAKVQSTDTFDRARRQADEALRVLARH